MKEAGLAHLKKSYIHSATEIYYFRLVIAY